MNPAAELNRILAICGGQPKDLELIELYREVEEQLEEDEDGNSTDTMGSIFRQA
jgi:hypothetical protein